METDAQYWALHEWLFKVYVNGLGNSSGRMPWDFAMTMIAGPDWRGKQFETMLFEGIQENLGYKGALLREVEKRLSRRSEAQ